MGGGGERAGGHGAVGQWGRVANSGTPSLSPRAASGPEAGLRHTCDRAGPRAEGRDPLGVRPHPGRWGVTLVLGVHAWVCVSIFSLLLVLVGETTAWQPGPHPLGDGFGRTLGKEGGVSGRSTSGCSQSGPGPGCPAPGPGCRILITASPTPPSTGWESCCSPTGPGPRAREAPRW